MERRAQISTSRSLLCERQKGNQIVRDMCAVSMVKGIEEACRRCAGRKLVRSAWAGLRGSEMPWPPLDEESAFQIEATVGAKAWPLQNNVVCLGKY